LRKAKADSRFGKKHNYGGIMPASMAEIVVPGGVRRFCCPATGAVLFDEEHGFDHAASGHSPHLRFFIDWAAGVYVAADGSAPPSHRGYLRRIREVWAAPGDDKGQDQLVAECLEALPQSAVVFEILDPPQGAHDGSVCYACYDFDPAAEEYSGVQLECVWE
jgi:hypothetical protein